MRRQIILATILGAFAPVLVAQHHGGNSTPPTAPVVPPIVAVSSGLGAIQFAQANYSVPAPQSLARQLHFDDERTRGAALASIGVPSQYLQHGHVATPRAITLEFAPIGDTEELDALLTVELEQHLVTAVLIPEDGNWRRIATLTFNTPFGNDTVTPTTWLRTSRSLIQKDKYRAIFHASTGSLTGNFSENEAHLRIVNKHAVITISFESTERECAAPPPAAVPGKVPTRTNARTGCNITQRWFQHDPGDPTQHFELVTATGHIAPKDAENPLANSRMMLMSQLRNFSCQPFVFSDSAQRYEPSGLNAPCRTK